MDEMSHNIKNLKNDIKTHYARLDSEAIWFFLATLGCWSVEPIEIKFLAMLTVFFFLFTQVFREHSSNSSFGQRVKKFRSDIENSNLEEHQKNQLIGQLTRMSDEYIPLIKIITKNYRFCVSSLFFAVSAVYFWQSWFFKLI